MTTSTTHSPGKPRTANGWRPWLAALSCLVLPGLASAGTPTPARTGQTLVSEQFGMQDGVFYSFWTDSPGTVSMTLGRGGHYSVQWAKTGSFTAGKGWAVGGRRRIHYKGRFDGGSNGYLAVYGWTRHPLVEYYIVEDHGEWVPPVPEAQFLGTVDSDGGTYKIYKYTRVNQPSIDGITTFDQYFSIRTTPRDSGTVTTGKHFDAWAKLGLKLGQFDYMILETEGYQSTGSSDVTVEPH